MKKLLFLFLVCYGSTVNSQNLNVASHDFNEEPGNLVSINSKCYYIEQHGFDCCSNDIRLKGMGGAGQTTFTLAYKCQGFQIPWANDRPVKLIRTLDKALVMIGWSQQEFCGGDVLQDHNTKNRLVKIDTNGVVRFDTLVPVVGNTEIIKDLVQFSDSSYYLISDSRAYHFSKTGHLMSSPNWGAGTYNSVALLANNHFLLNTVGQNKEITMTGSVVSQQTASSNIIKFRESASGDLYGLTSTHTLEKYTAGLMLESVSSLSASVLLSDFELRHDSVFAVGSNTASGNTPCYSVMSSSLTVLYQAQSALENIRPGSIAIDNKNKINCIAKGSSLNTSLAFSSYYKFPSTGSFVSVSDVGVQAFSVSSCTFYPQSYSPFMVMHPAYASFDADVVVKNYGTDTVKSFCLNHLTNLGLCGSFNKRYAVTIPPGGTILVHAPGVLTDAIPVPDGTAPNTVVNLMNCFFTTVPNASADIHLNNDQFCGPVPVTLIITGIEKNTLPEMNIKEFPNPFNSQLDITSDVMIKEVKIYNVMGALHYAAEVNKNAVKLDGISFSPGIYFIKLDTERGTVVKKIIKE